MKKIFKGIIYLPLPFLVISCNSNVVKNNVENEKENSNNINIPNEGQNKSKTEEIIDDKINNDATTKKDDQAQEEKEDNNTNQNEINQIDDNQDIKTINISKIKLVDNNLIFELENNEEIKLLNNSRTVLNYRLKEIDKQLSSITDDSIKFNINNIDGIEIISLTSENQDIKFNILNKQIEIEQKEEQIIDKVNNPKDIFSKNEFPKNIIIKDNIQNRMVIERYFQNELLKSISFINGNFMEEPEKWTHLSFQTFDGFDGYKQIPNLQVKFKDPTTNNAQVYITKIMPTLVQDNNLEIDDQEIILNRDITNYLNKKFFNKKISFYIKTTTSFQVLTFNYTFDLDLLIQTPLKTVDDSNNFEINAEIVNNNLKVRIKPLNKNKISFDKLEENGLLVDKLSTVTSVSYFTNQEQEFTLFSKPTNQNLSTLNSNEDFYNNNTSAKLLDVANNQDELFKKIRERVFVVGGGTMTMLSKVKPSDDNDFRYYFITNRHVVDILKNRWSDHRVMKKMMIPHSNDSLVRNADRSISIDINKEWFEFGFWESSNQTNTSGVLKNDGTQNADFAISIIDIKPIINKAQNENNINILNYLNNWKTLKAIKLSPHSKYLSEHSNVDFRIGSFPLDNFAGFSGRRYREHIINKIDKIILNDQAQEFEKYGHFRTFVLKDTPSNKLDLISGASGSVVFDNNLNMVALFMQNIGNDDRYGFGLLASPDYDYFGFNSNNNPNSFKNKLTSEISKNPSKFELIDF
ncbi:hypothetical protein [Mycoplasma sp. OR1901]|uniref:hypothetical protein n=1 Tax=Mycoplasma sp. OR1901 TaxID=2742195 RepID=UPI001581C83E|nr:hypothetical protein [Mycoplasma sp. OR1901]QKT05460.1 hypothetical protein HTZ87_01950 [Mycoplasma sp. OR1901]